jgi:hypothetical protein
MVNRLSRISLEAKRNRHSEWLFGSHPETGFAEISSKPTYVPA